MMIRQTSRVIAFRLRYYWSTISIAVVLCLAPHASGQQVSLKNGKSLIDPQDLPASMVAILGALGGRMMTADKSQIAIAGSITDSAGTRAAQIVVQSPGYLSYREGQGRAITFNGAQFKAKAGSPSVDDERILESLLAHFPDAVMLQFAAGGGWRRIGSHFRTDSGKAANYTGPYWTLFAFSPADRPGLARGQALQQEILIAIDEKTGLISEIRTVANTGLQQMTVTQTQFNNWVQQTGQWFPGQIVRLENGKQVLSFQAQQAAVGPSSAVAAFEP
jgi:hypothetical protein